MILCTMACFAQTEADLYKFAMERGDTLLETRSNIQNTYKVHNNKSVIKPLFVLYKAVFSEQFAADCAYNPSCSLFAINVVKKKGLIKGILLALDRLTRCHSFVDTENSYLYHNLRNDTYDDTTEMY